MKMSVADDVMRMCKEGCNCNVIVEFWSGRCAYYR